MMAVVQCLLVLALLVVHSEGQSEGITGLVDNSTLTEWAKFPGANGPYYYLSASSNSRQYLFPGWKFRCNGTVTKWLIGARFNDDGNRNRYPALGIYGPRGGNIADRVGASVFVHEADIPSNVYEFTPDPPLPFQDGDSLGIFVPTENESRLDLFCIRATDGPAFQHYVPSRPSPYGVSMFDFGANGISGVLRDLLPLIGVEIESDEPDSTGCTRDFINRDLLELLAFDVHYNGLQIVSSGFRFPRDGVITSWTLAAIWIHASRNSFPELQIWRRVNGTIYEKIDNTTMTATAQSPNRLYSGTIDPPLQFQSGDLLGIHLPSTSVARLWVTFTYGLTFEFRWSSVPLSSIELGKGVVNYKLKPYLALGIVFSSTISPSTIATATAPEPPTIDSTSPISTEPPTTESASPISIEPPTTESASPISTEPPTTDSASPISTEPPTTESASPISTEPPTTDSASPISTEPHPIESASPSSTDPFVTDSPSSSQTVTIAIGVVAVVLVLAVLAVVIIVAVLCRLNRKRVVSQHSNGADQPSGKEDPIYDYPIRIETTVFTKRNEAYATTAVSAAPNQAYATACGGNIADAEYEYIY